MQKVYVQTGFHDIWIWTNIKAVLCGCTCKLVSMAWIIGSGLFVCSQAATCMYISAGQLAMGPSIIRTPSRLGNITAVAGLLWPQYTLEWPRHLLWPTTWTKPYENHAIFDIDLMPRSLPCWGYYGQSYISMLCLLCKYIYMCTLSLVEISPKTKYRNIQHVILRKD